MPSKRRITSRFTVEERENMINERKKWLDSLSLEYQLGTYIGEKIVDDYLPTLSIDMLQSRNVIIVSPEDTKRYNVIDRKWASLAMSRKEDIKTDNEWADLMKIRKELQSKYLPKQLNCTIPILNVSEKGMIDLKKGIVRSLWDCDMCSYDTETISIENDSSLYYTHVNINLDEK